MGAREKNRLADGSWPQCDLKEIGGYKYASPNGLMNRELRRATSVRSRLDPPPSEALWRAGGGKKHLKIVRNEIFHEPEEPEEPEVRFLGIGG